MSALTFWLRGVIHDLDAALNEWRYCRDMRKRGDPNNDYF